MNDRVNTLIDYLTLGVAHLSPPKRKLFYKTVKIVAGLATALGVVVALLAQMHITIDNLKDPSWWILVLTFIATLFGHMADTHTDTSVPPTDNPPDSVV